MAQGKTGEAAAVTDERKIKFLGDLRDDEEILDMAIFQKKIIIATNQRVLCYDSETESLREVEQCLKSLPQ